jgi:hypothetical protein
VRAGKATVEEWGEAVERLFSQIKSWLSESDLDGYIRLEEGKENITEPGLRHSEIPRLDLNAFGKWVGVAQPPQRQAPERAEGRVDITDELRCYVLYRFRNGEQDVWMIDDLHSGAKPLDQESFEKALMSYFR